jgi:hypothetical protein
LQPHEIEGIFLAVAWGFSGIAATVAAGFRRERSLTHKVIHSACALFPVSLKNNYLRRVLPIKSEDFEHYNLRGIAT